MEETKIWAVDGTSAAQLETTNRMETEGLLEDILTANPEMLEGGLQLVGRQISTAGGPLDLLGVDIYGKLVVFELKRGTLNRDAVAQVIDYASDLNAKDANSLHKHISGQSGNHKGIEKIDDFESWYNDLRENSGLPEEDLEPLVPPRMVLVGLGVDETTERMVNYMASIGMRISLLTFHGFVNIDGKTLLARNLEVDIDSIPNRPRASSGYQGRTLFDELAQEQGVEDLLGDIADMFRSEIRGDQPTHSSTRRNFNLDYSWHEETVSDRVATFFIEIDKDKNSVNVGFHPIAIGLAREEFSDYKNEGFEEGPSKLRKNNIGQIDYEVKLPIHKVEEWNAHKERLTALTRKVWEGYDAAKTKALAGE